MEHTMKFLPQKITSLVGIFALTSLFSLAACGDDSSSTSPERTSVKTIYELGECSSKNKNETLYVSEEGEDYTCSNKNGKYTWGSESEEDDGDGNYSSEKSSVKSSSSSVIDQTVYYSSAMETEYKDENESYLYKEFSVEIDLTLFKQVSDNWEEYKSHKGNYSDGDPGVKFQIITYADEKKVDSVQTEMFKIGEDVGKWTGHHYFTHVFSGGVNQIYICPGVFERNVVESNVLHSSSYCYIIHDAGNKVDTPIKQNDSEATDCELEWTVTVSYK
jgi:hypothetical protein